MDRDVEERFERIEANLERVSGFQDELRIAHMDLEAAQRSTQKSLDRFIQETRKQFHAVGERIDDLAILVNQLIERDLEKE